MGAVASNSTRITRATAHRRSPRNRRSSDIVAYRQLVRYREILAWAAHRIYHLDAGLAIDPEIMEDIVEIDRFLNQLCDSLGHGIDHRYCPFLWAFALGPVPWEEDQSAAQKALWLDSFHKKVRYRP